MQGRAWATALGGAICLGVALATVRAAAAATLVGLVGAPLPLAIRDGRVAQLTVHAIPFPVGGKDLEATTSAALETFLAGIATNCFLNAQAIGHVQPGTPGDGDTLAAHRLARARAELVRDAFVRGGLPKDSVAAVWDYQFTVREPRVTLWVFELAAGDDCTGSLLPRAAALVAAAVSQDGSVAEPVPTAASTAAATVGVTVRRRELEPAPGIHLPDQAQPSVALAAESPRVVKAVPIVAPEPSQRPVAMPATEGHAEVAVLPPPAESARPLQPVVPTAIAEAAPEAGPAPIGSVGAPSRSSGGEGAVTAEIVFQENSSFLPPGAETELQRLVAELAPGRGWKLEIEAAVDDKPGRRQKPAEAVAYNTWLAGRRQGRVADWLGRQSGIQVVDVRRGLLEHDPSRRVVVRARPLP